MAAVKNVVKRRAICHSAAEDEHWPLGGIGGPCFFPKQETISLTRGTSGS